MTRRLTITLSPSTVGALNREDMALYLFAAVRHGPFATGASGTAGGVPVVWFRRDRLLAKTTLVLAPALSLYLSPTPIAPHAVVSAEEQVDLALGQAARLGRDGRLTPVATGLVDTVSLINDGDQPWTWGLSLSVDGRTAPVCAFPLHGGAMGMIAPTDRILAVFATDSTPMGAMVDTAFGPGLMIDFTEAGSRVVAFDIDKGWDWGDATWAKSAPAGSPLSPLLIIR